MEELEAKPIKTEIKIKSEVFDTLEDKDRALILAIQDLTIAINQLRERL